MLKYQLRPSRSTRSEDPIDALPTVSRPSSQSLSRSDSLSSVNSLENPNYDWIYFDIFEMHCHFDRDSPAKGVLKVDVSGVNEMFHYKSLRVSLGQDVASIVPILLTKLKIPSDAADYALWMEVKTRRDANFIVSSLLLDPTSKPLQLQKSLPEEMSRFILLPSITS